MSTQRKLRRCTSLFAGNGGDEEERIEWALWACEIRRIDIPVRLIASLTKMNNHDSIYLP